MKAPKTTTSRGHAIAASIIVTAAINQCIVVNCTRAESSVSLLYLRSQRILHANQLCVRAQPPPAFARNCEAQSPAQSATSHVVASSRLGSSKSPHHA